MQSYNVREINAAVERQAMRGTCSVRIEQGRVIHARKRQEQLQVKILGAENWINVESVNIEQVQPGPAPRVSQKGGYTTMQYTMEELYKLNKEHGNIIFGDDLTKVNQMINLIALERQQPAPTTGDCVRCFNTSGSLVGNAHLDKKQDRIELTLAASVPFIYAAVPPYCSVSGGPEVFFRFEEFSAETFKGKVPKYFRISQVLARSVIFSTQVNLWEIHSSKFD
jgi:hypothetical protein